MRLLARPSARASTVTRRYAPIESWGRKYQKLPCPQDVRIVDPGIRGPDHSHDPWPGVSIVATGQIGEGIAVGDLDSQVAGGRATDLRAR
jgi:hypothetical protein